jgi:4-amino-4-deoxy-L-arabinose transferase-like glycosyltransferase
MSVGAVHVRDLGTRRLALGAAAIILMFALGLRVFWATTVTPEQVSDARSYASAALELAAGRGYRDNDLPTAYYPIGYAATLAVFHKLFGPELAVARAANLCLAALTLLGVFCVARRLTRSRLAAVLALLWFALYPADIAYTSITLSQPAFNAFALAGVALCVCAQPARVWAVLAGGVLLGCATLTRNQGVALPLILCLLWLSDRKRAQRRAAILLALAFVCTLAPWTIRNAWQLHAFAPVSTNAGINLYIGNNPSARGRYRYTKQLEAPLIAGLSGPRRGGTNEVIVDRRAASLAWEWAAQHPTAAFALWGPKLQELFGSDGAALGYWSKRVAEPSQSTLIARVRDWNEWYYLALMSLGIVGLLRAVWQVCTRWRSSDRLLLLPGAAVAVFTALHLLTFGDPCYHHPMMPWIAVYAGYALAAPFRRDTDSPP